MKLIKLSKKAFTIVELVIVIAVIAVLASVLIPTFSNIVSKANQSKAMQEAKNAWNDVSYYYVSGYKGFAADNGEMNGWYFDYKDNVAKYCIDEKYTVTYNGEQFIVNGYDNSEYKWGAITKNSIDYNSNTIGTKPFGLTVTYYSNVYSRGFSWLTNTSVTNSKLYLVESNLGIDADFNVEPVNNTPITHNNFNSHKVHVEDLKAGTVYSYKLGSSEGWEYGVFRTDSESSSKITALSLTDAQTLDGNLLYKWENTVAQAVETAGHKLNMVLFDGDQADNNAPLPNGANYTARYGLAREVIKKYMNNLPYMSASGNHEPASNSKIQWNNNDIKYANKESESNTGCYYSYDKDFAHFIVLNSNDLSENQIDWLKTDLNNTKAKWKIVMMHNGPYATGDHSNNNGTQNIIKKLTPIFSQYHVDLVLQGHDHTYNKTLPYKWDAAGYTETYGNSNVVNLNPSTIVYNGITYDNNPNGTYYVTTGAAGHRTGANEPDGNWATVVKDANGNAIASGLKDTNNKANCYLNNKYKIEIGKISETNTIGNFTYSVGDYATGNIDAQMFGLLEIEDLLLTYKFYTVDGNNVKLFDTLNIAKN